MVRQWSGGCRRREAGRVFPAAYIVHPELIMKTGRCLGEVYQLPGSDASSSRSSLHKLVAASPGEAASRWLGGAYASFLLKPWTRVVCAAAFAVYIGASLAGCASLVINIDPKKLTLSGPPLSSDSFFPRPRFDLKAPPPSTRTSTWPRRTSTGTRCPPPSTSSSRPPLRRPARWRTSRASCKLWRPSRIPWGPPPPTCGSETSRPMPAPRV